MRPIHMRPIHSFKDSRGMIYVDCSECNHGGSDAEMDALLKARKQAEAYFEEG